jgi:hypothetical protein
LQTQTNSIACTSSAPVCDLTFFNNPSITPASNISTNDGSFTVAASSSNGTIKFGLTNFDYATEGQTSGLFSTRYAGSYTVYAKDANGCVATLVVTVPTSAVYAIHYRSEWKDSRARLHRVDIYESGYVGTVIDIKAGDIPAIYKLNSDGEERNYVIRASEFRFRAYTNVDFQYSALYTEDERQFLPKYYIDNVLEWSGFVTPFLYNEPYTSTPYEIEIIATDGLASLKDLDFLDISGNRFPNKGTQLNFITAILFKLGLSINVRSGINEYENSMPSTATDDPLFYARISPNVYYEADGTPAKCDVVIKNILKEYAAVICQADGVWTIYRPEETIASFTYREFDLTGAYVSNGTIDPVAYLRSASASNRIRWVEESGNMTIIPSYGKFTARQLLNRKASLFPSYGFEPKDVVPFGGNTFFFSGWNININSGSAITWGVEDTNRGDSQSAMFISFAPYNDSTYKEVSVYTLSTPIQFISGDQLKFGFDYFIGLLQQFPWVTIQYKIKIGNFYLSPDDVLTATDYGYRDLYATTFNQWQTFSKTVDSPGVNSLTDTTADFYLKITNNASNPALDVTALKALATTEVGKKYIVPVTVGTTTVRGFYELEYGTDAESIPSVIRPNTYAAVTNEKVYRLKGSNNGLITVQKLMLDNAILEYLPGGERTPEFQESSVVTNPNNKRELVVEIQHGDYPTAIVNSLNAYDSYIEYSGDSTPTSVWKRDAITEGDKIQNVMLKSYIAQFQKASRRLQGNVISNGPKLRPYSCVIETMDSDRKYQMQGFEVEYKEETYTIDLYELKNVTVGEGGASPFNGAFDPAAFGVQFD